MVGAPVVQVTSKPIEVRYRLEGINIEGSNVLLSETFAQLAALLQRGVIKDFALVRTNMEQVFINFAKFQIQGAIDGVPDQANAAVSN